MTFFKKLRVLDIAFDGKLWELHYWRDYYLFFGFLFISYTSYLFSV